MAITRHYNTVFFFLGGSFRWDKYLLENRYNPECLRFWARFGERDQAYIQQNHEETGVYSNINNILHYLRRQLPGSVGELNLDMMSKIKVGAHKNELVLI